MDRIIIWFKTQFVNFSFPFHMPKTPEFIDLVQIIMIAWFVYHLILWVKNTRAYVLFKGIILIAAFVLIARVFQMNVILQIFKGVSVAAITALVIIFQPELRRVLEQLGDKNFFHLLSLGSAEGQKDKRFSDKTLNELVRACYEMGEVKTGALIVIEQNISLTDYEKTGIPVDAIMTGQLLINIFEKNTPLHDGAVILRGDRVTSATCYLPLSESMSLSKDLGTRHRAAVGISEVSDSFTIVVSEETGNVSYALNGEITTAVNPNELREQLHKIQKLDIMPESSRIKHWKERVKHEKQPHKKADE